MTSPTELIAAVLQFIRPDAEAFTIDDATAAALERLGISTGDRLLQRSTSTQPGPITLPSPADGQLAVEVVEASEREWDDSGVVITLVLRPVTDATVDHIRVRLDESTETRRVVRRIALAALGGLDDGQGINALIGRQAIVELGVFTGRDGQERTCVRRWITPRKPRGEGQSNHGSKPKASAARPRKPETVEPATDDIPF